MNNQKLGCGALLLSDRLQEVVNFEMQRQLPQAKSILLFQRGYGAPTFAGCFGGPGGILEASKGETPPEAAARETMEETNIIFSPETDPFYMGEMPDRNLQYFVGDWAAPGAGIVYNDFEVIGHLWADRELALVLAESGKLSFHYQQAVEKLIAEDLL
jgi:8-oxo-dGTP pyrophosphatase MutT (NUDIX family)